MKTDGTLKQSWLDVQTELNDFVQRHPDRSPVRLIAVSKKQPVQKIRDLYALGQKDFAENYVQEGVEKVRELAALSINWHFVGRLQTKKIPLVVEHFSWIHSVARLVELEKLIDCCARQSRQIQVFLQINIANESSKQGFSEAELRSLARDLNSASGVLIRGLMVFPPLANSEEESRMWFAKGREIFLNLRSDFGTHFDRLSMGTSGDYLLAMEEGATDIRVGEKLFGPRI